MNHTEKSRLGFIEGGLSITVNMLLFGAKYAAGVSSFSTAIKTDGWHHRSDAVTSVVILAGVFMGGKFPAIDGIMGIAISLFIFHAAYEIIKNVSGSILGAAPEQETEDRINAVIKARSAGNANLHHLHIHRYGDHTEATFHVRFSAEISLADAHARATKIENAVKDELGIEATIHIEPE
ncbi:MAG: cation diffusion facilitator family transporter [Elusimicrobiota bacterium]|nr:cation diffusion facilitator family transporter [Elusimicrobiota bacterium]